MSRITHSLCSLFSFDAGKETGTSAVGTKTEESAVTEERIAHILHEASAALRAQQVDDSASDESKSPSQAQVRKAPLEVTANVRDKHRPRRLMAVTGAACNCSGAVVLDSFHADNPLVGRELVSLRSVWLDCATASENIEQRCIESAFRNARSMLSVTLGLVIRE